MKRSRDDAETEATCRADWVRAAMSYPARLTAYGFVAFSVCQLVFMAIRVNGIGFAALENGPVEKAQVWLALFACGCLFYSASRMRVGRTGLILCACMVGYAAARECDTWFEAVFFDDAYKYLGGKTLYAFASIAFYRGRKHVFRESLALVRSPSITIFAIAGIYICSLCQVIDRPDLWLAIGETAEAETTKAAVEEFAELFGYLLLAFSGIEAVAMAFATCESKVTARQSRQLIVEPGVSVGLVQ